MRSAWTLAAWGFLSGLAVCVGWAMWEEIRDRLRRRAIQREMQKNAAEQREREHCLPALADPINFVERRKALQR